MMMADITQLICFLLVIQETKRSGEGSKHVAYSLREGKSILIENS